MCQTKNDFSPQNSSKEKKKKNNVIICMSAFRPESLYINAMLRGYTDMPTHRRTISNSKTDRNHQC